MDLEKLAAQARGILYAILVLGVVLVLSGIILAWSTLNAASALDLNWTMSVERATPGFVLGAIGLLISVLPCMLLPLTAALFRRAIDARYRFEQLMGSIENQRQLLESIRQTASLSDAAKQIAYRQKDLEALRAAIREDAEKGDFEAATMLANEMERRFGYSLEANKLRDHIQQTSKAAIDLRVRETIEHVELLLNRHDWTDAQRECDRLLRSFPNHTEARRLPDRISQAKDNHKRELLKMWKDAVAKDDVDRSVELLKQLDPYLAPSEAEAYKEAARDVFKKRLQQLGVQFALHVHDKNWNEALRIGRQIIDEYPNTRMAAEVKERMVILEGKAQQPLAV